MNPLVVELTATDGTARTGRVITPRGSYRVPAFMPVGTKGAVKALDSTDLEALGELKARQLADRIRKLLRDVDLLARLLVGHPSRADPR